MADPTKTHYPQAGWIDFARGLARPSVGSSMDAHLRSNCADCRSMCDFARTLAEFGAEEQSLEVPASFVSSAVSAFCPLPATVWLDSLERIFAELIPGRPIEALLTGVRSGGCAGPVPGSPFTQRLLYRAGDYDLDLSVEPCLESGQRAIAGQVAHQAGESLDGAIVQVWVDGAPAAETRANLFGEFVAEFRDGRAVELRIGLLVSGRRLDVSLPVIQ